MSTRFRVFGLSSVVVLTLAGAVQGEELAAVDPASITESLLAQISQVDSIHMRARYQLSFETDERSVGNGWATLEFWASGDRFRVVSIVAPELSAAGLAGDQTITFDGSESRLLSHSNRTLIIRGGEIPDSSVVPNPLFIPLAFLKVESRACAGCRPSLADFRKQAARPAVVGIARPAPFVGPARTAQLTIPGGTLRDGTQEIHFTMQGSSWSVLDAVSLGADGALRERHSFGRIEAIEGTDPRLLMPRSLVLEHWSDGGDLPNGATAARIEITVEEVVVNQPVEDAIFTIPENLAATVIDEDLHQVVRAPSCSPAGGVEHE